MIVCSYKNPDLDSFSCAIAYSEYLNLIWLKSDYFISWKPHKEVSFACDFLNFKPKKYKIKEWDKFCMVDFSSVESLDSDIKTDKVLEIIDHRQASENDLKPFIKAKIQIEKVWSCATLIAEKFISKNLDFSYSSGVLLALAIASNTLNFKWEVTTDRDKKAFHFIVNKLKMERQVIEDMFIFKSQIPDNFEDLKDYILSDSYISTTNNWSILFSQLELYNFNNKKVNIIWKIMEELSREKDVDSYFMNILDIKANKNFILIKWDFIKNKIEEKFWVEFKWNFWLKDWLTLRKQYMEYIKNN